MKRFYAFALVAALACVFAVLYVLFQVDWGS